MIMIDPTGCPVRFVDSLFVAAAALCVAGHNPSIILVGIKSGSRRCCLPARRARPMPARRKIGRHSLVGDRIRPPFVGNRLRRLHPSSGGLSKEQGVARSANRRRERPVSLRPPTSTHQPPGQDSEGDLGSVLEAIPSSRRHSCLAHAKANVSFKARFGLEPGRP